MIDISKYMTDAGDQKVPYKPQYIRGGNIFTCPVCGWQENSHRFIWYSGFEDACKEHLAGHDHGDQEVIDARK